MSNSNEIMVQKHLFSHFLECQLKNPVVTRWNSEYDSVLFITELDQAKLEKVMKKLKLEPLSSGDRTLLKEYVAVKGPFAIYLDVMQSERNTYLGCVIPCISKIKTAMAEVKNLPCLMGMGSTYVVE